MYHDIGKEREEIYLINKEYFMAFQFTVQDPFAQMRKTGVIRNHSRSIQRRNFCTNPV